MKFTVFALIVGLCLVSANVSPGDPIEVETQDFTSVLVYALRGLKGINCSLKGVVNLKNASLGFLNDIGSCGTQASSQVLAVIESCKQIIVICDNIIHFKTDLCVLHHPNGSEIQESPVLCVRSVAKEMQTLRSAVENAINNIHSVPDIYTDTNTCLKTALSDLENSFLSYPSDVVECSKLKS